jgi:hypothetical protein
MMGLQSDGLRNVKKCMMRCANIKKEKVAAKPAFFFLSQNNKLPKS